MNHNLPNYIPPVGFYFSVQMLGEGAPPTSPLDAAFQEVSGISVTLETESIKEGGENRFTHKVPGRTTYQDLVLKRGLMAQSSGLADWCQQTLEGGLTQKIEPKTIMVSLLDANTDSGRAMMTWKFVNAYPVQWEIAPLAAQASEITIERITFAYSYFEREDAPAAKNHP